MSQADIIASFSKIQKSMANANPNTGGAFFPDAGKHQCLVEDVVFEPNSSIKMGSSESPAMSIAFRYRLINDPESPSTPRAFTGKTFYLPYDESAYVVAAGKKGNKFAIESDRFAGHLKTLLGRDVNTANTASEFALVFAKVKEAAASSRPIVVELETRIREYDYTRPDGTRGEGTDRQEYLQKLLST